MGTKKKFACRDAGLTCEWMVFSDDDDVLVTQVREHAARTHGESHLHDDEGRIRSTIKSI